MAMVPKGRVKPHNQVLNFEQYSTEAISIVSMILNGVLSPATMGMMLLKDNSTHNEKKEKVTIMTRNNIIAKSKIIAELVTYYLPFRVYRLP